MKIPNLVQRVALAAVGIPLVYLCLKQGDVLFLIAVDIVIFFCLLEFTALSRSGNLRPNRLFTILGGLAVSLDLHFSGGRHFPQILFFTLTASLLYGLIRGNHGTFFTDAAMSLLAVVFVGVGIGSLLSIRHLQGGEAYTILVFALIWLCDSFAYFVGKFFGRHRLWPAVSPKKTVEGTVAGLIAACLAAVAVKQILIPRLSFVDCLVLGSIVGVLGQAGDLVESAFKRSVAVKDSSSYLPGHGGFLDRFDSFVFTVPTLYIYIRTVLQ